MATPTPPTPSQNYDAAIQSNSSDSMTLFTTAHNAVPIPAFAPITDEPEDAKKSRALSAMTMALSQLEQAVTRLDEQQHRDGHASVVKLMADTATTAATVCAAIRTLVGASGPASTSFDAIRLMNETLTALAALSPAAVWAAPAATPEG